MSDEDINYEKEVLKADPNLAFLGVMGALMIAVNFWGFLPLMLAGELGAVVMAQNERVQRLIRAKKNKGKRILLEADEEAEFKSMPLKYQQDFVAVKTLCEEIEKRSQDLGESGTHSVLDAIIDKLSSFRRDYIRMSRAHYFLSNRNNRQIEASLMADIAKTEQSIAKEGSAQVRHALNQNLTILGERLSRNKKLDELVRLLDARLQATRNSLSLIQDEVYTFTDVAGFSGLLDNLLTNLAITDEFRSSYEDFINLSDGIEPVTIQSSGASSSVLTMNSERSERDSHSKQTSKLRPTEKETKYDS